MELYSTLSSLFTVISFLVFLGIVAWAYGRRRQEAFAEAANEPFALPEGRVNVMVQRIDPTTLASLGQLTAGRLSTRCPSKNSVGWLSPGAW